MADELAVKEAQWKTTTTTDQGNLVSWMVGDQIFLGWREDTDLVIVPEVYNTESSFIYKGAYTQEVKQRRVE